MNFYACLVHYALFISCYVNQKSHDGSVLIPVLGTSATEIANSQKCCKMLWGEIR